MNMKKTIAAVAASAMAVSAMATTLTASADRTLHYGLVDKTEVTTGAGGFSIAATIPTTSGSITSGSSKIEFGTGAGVDFTVDTITIELIDDQNNANRKSYTYSTDKGAANWNPNLTNTAFTFGDEATNFNANDFSVVVKVDCKEVVLGDLDSFRDVNDDIDAGTIAITGDFIVGVATPTTVVAANEATKTTFEYPFRTGPSNNQNIIWYLQNANVRDGGKYTNVMPVINDAISANESITFTFNTAAQNIKWVIGNGTTKYGTYNEAVVNAGVGNEVDVHAVYDADGTNAYTNFTQHLYTGTSDVYFGQLSPTGWQGYVYGEDYLGFNWAGQNLFGGALVVNENITMQLSDVDYFDWTQTTISFDWDAIRDNAITTNDFATYVQSLKLATSTIWYWDSLDINIIEGEADDASSSAGVEGNNETLEDDDDDNGDITLDDGDDDEGPAVVDDDDEGPADAGNDVVSVPSPQTGNAPVALAVIPVALAAAAIVAKKRS